LTLNDIRDVGNGDGKIVRGQALQDILALSNDERDSTVKKLDDVLHVSRTTQRAAP